jgi:hypothetical protein
MRSLKVAVGCPAAFFASGVETDSHEGDCWVGVMRGTQQMSVSRADTGGAGTGAAGVRRNERERGQQQPRNEAGLRLEEENRNGR